jgi:hypothetical protein
MKWTINYYNQSVKEDARMLPKSIKAKFEAIMDKILEHGLISAFPLPEQWEKDCLKFAPKGKKELQEECFALFLKIPLLYFMSLLKRQRRPPKKNLFGY